MNAISSVKQKVIFSTVMVSHGVKKTHLIFLSSLWGAMTVLNLARLLVLVSCTKSKRCLAIHATLAYTEMTASGYPKHHDGKQSSSKKYLCGIFSDCGLKITINY